MELSTNNKNIDLMVDRLVYRLNEMVKQAVFNNRSEKDNRIRWRDNRINELNGKYMTFKKTNEYINTAVDALAVAVEKYGVGLVLDTNQAKMSLLSDVNNAFNAYKKLNTDELYNKMDTDYIYTNG